MKWSWVSSLIRQGYLIPKTLIHNKSTYRLTLTLRGVPLNTVAITIWEELLWKHPKACFTYMNQPIRLSNCNMAWYRTLSEAGLEDSRFHDLRHTWASWHRQAGTSCDEFKDLGGWKTRLMVDCYAKFATENLAFAASRVELSRGG